MRRGRRQSSGSGAGRWGSSLKRLWYRRPWGRWGSDSGALSEYREVGNRDKLGVSGCIGDGRVRNGSSWALGVAVSLRLFLDFEPLAEEEEGGEEDGNVVGVNGDNHQSGLLG